MGSLLPVKMKDRLILSFFLSSSFAENLFNPLSQICHIDGSTRIQFTLTDDSLDILGGTVGTCDIVISKQAVPTTAHAYLTEGSRLYENGTLDTDYPVYYLEYKAFDCGETDTFVRDISVIMDIGFLNGFQKHYMKKIKFQSTCDFASDQKAILNMDMNSAAMNYDVNTIRTPTRFSLIGWLHDYEDTEVLQDTILTSGKKLYVTIDSSLDPTVDNFVYVPRKCDVYESGPNGQSFTIFDLNADPVVATPALDFNYFYDGHNRSWGFSYRIFTFSVDDGENTHKLECDIKFCINDWSECLPLGHKAGVNLLTDTG